MFVLKTGNHCNKIIGTALYLALVHFLNLVYNVISGEHTQNTSRKVRKRNPFSKSALSLFCSNLHFERREALLLLFPEECSGVCVCDLGEIGNAKGLFCFPLFALSFVR